MGDAALAGILVSLLKHVEPGFWSGILAIVIVVTFGVVTVSIAAFKNSANFRKASDHVTKSIEDFRKTVNRLSDTLIKLATEKDRDKQDIDRLSNRIEKIDSDIKDIWKQFNQ